jgi:hypothetical protein
MNIRGIQQEGGTASQRASKNVRFRGLEQLGVNLFKALPPPVNLNSSLSLVDIVSRVQVIPSVYIPQGIYSIRLKEHPWETNTRNLLAWLGALGVTYLVKHKTLGLNMIFNQFLLPAEKLPRNASPLSHLINRLKPDGGPQGRYNYLKLMEDAGIDIQKLGYKGNGSPQSYLKAVKEQPYWTGLDVLQKKALVRLSKNPQVAQDIQNAASKLIQRMAVCKYLAVISAGILLTLTIGVFMQKLIFKFVAPLDEKYERERSLTPSHPQIFVGANPRVRPTSSGQTHGSAPTPGYYRGQSS